MPTEISSLLIFIASLAGLVGCATGCVEYSAMLARRFHVSDLTIGLTLTAVGTSVPEVASAIAASLQGHAGIGIGNIVGSNIANIGLILGVVALVRPFALKPYASERDSEFLVAASLAAYLLTFDGHFGRYEAGGFLLVYVAYISFVARTEARKVPYHFYAFLIFFFRIDYIRHLFMPRRSTKLGPRARENATKLALVPVVRDVSVLVLCCGGLAISAKYLIVEAVGAAQMLAVPESVVGLSVISIGTSLPELALAISAAAKKRPSMIVGNVIGSNIANLLLALGISGVIEPIGFASISLNYTMPVMLLYTLYVFYLVRSGRQITRTLAGLMLGAYGVFITLAFGLGWG